MKTHRACSIRQIQLRLQMKIRILGLCSIFLLLPLSAVLGQGKQAQEDRIQAPPQAVSTSKPQRPVFQKIDRLAADEKAARYRTGSIDPISESIPQHIEQAAFKNPGPASLSALVQALKADTEDEFLLAKRIHDWITLRIAYDSDLLIRLRNAADPEGSNETWGVLRYQRTNCVGFARLFQAMASLAGLEAEYVTGLLKGGTTQSGTFMNHAWNIVLLEDGWYIVDCSADSRRFYTQGRLGDLMEYQRRSDHLFIHPEAKRLAYLAHEERWQIAKPALSQKEFAELPRFLVTWAKYGLVLQDAQPPQSGLAQIRSGSGGLSLFDEYTIGEDPSRSPVLKLRIQTPPDSFLTVYLKDEEGTEWPDYASAERQGEDLILRFSAPYSGNYRATILCRTLSEPDIVNVVYEFQLSAAANGDYQRLPVQTSYMAPLLGVSIVEQGRTVEGDMWIDVAAPEDVQVVSVVWNSEGTMLSGRVRKTPQAFGWRFTYALADTLLQAGTIQPTKLPAVIGISGSSVPDTRGRGNQRIFTLPLTPPPPRAPEQPEQRLLRAAQTGDIPALEEAAREHASVNTRDMRGRTPLILAARAGQLQAIDWLLDRGADTSLQDVQAGWTALHHAVEQGRLEAAKRLLAAGADAAATDKENQSPWDIAYKERQHEISALFLSSSEEGKRLGRAFPLDQPLVSGLRGGLLISLTWFTGNSPDRDGAVRRFSQLMYTSAPGQDISQSWALNPAGRIEVRQQETRVLVLDQDLPVTKNSIELMGWMADITMASDLAREMQPEQFPPLNAPLPGDIREAWTADSEEYQINSAPIRNIVDPILRRSHSYGDVIEGIWTWVHENMVYQWNLPERSSTAPEVIAAGRGRCSEFARLSVALFRAAGIPARQVSSLVALENDPQRSNHNWSEVYIPGSGWLSIHTQQAPPQDAYFRINFKEYFVTERGTQGSHPLGIATLRCLASRREGTTYLIPLAPKDRASAARLLQSILARKNNPTQAIWQQLENASPTLAFTGYWILLSSSDAAISQRAAAGMYRCASNDPKIKIQTIISQSPAPMAAILREAQSAR